MKLFTIDRTGQLRANNIIRLFNDYTYNKHTTETEQWLQFVKRQFPAGISEHGNRYLFDDSGSSEQLQETIFEYVRQQRYSDQLSRFQSFFAIEATDLDRLAFVLKCTSGQYQVFEVAGSRVEKHDMLLLKGNSFVNCSYYAEQYWSGGHTENPLYEYLMQPPVSIIRRVNLGG